MSHLHPESDIFALQHLFPSVCSSGCGGASASASFPLTIHRLLSCSGSSVPVPRRVCPATYPGVRLAWKFPSFFSELNLLFRFSLFSQGIWRVTNGRVCKIARGVGIRCVYGSEIFQEEVKYRKVILLWM